MLHRPVGDGVRVIRSTARYVARQGSRCDIKLILIASFSLNPAFSPVRRNKGERNRLPQVAVDSGFGAVRLEPVDDFLVVRNAFFEAFLLVFVFH